jgi:CxxC motif-containing protein (DUF1111 family)
MKLTTPFCLGFPVALALISLCTGHNAGADPASEKDMQRLAKGEELFTREWLHGDRRSHAGDGLGPVFNARSCVACHHLGGAGGAGGNETNVTIVSLFVQPRDDQPPGPGVAFGLFDIFLSGALPRQPDRAKQPDHPKQPDRAKLAKIHPALSTENSFPVHRFGVETEFLKWRHTFLGENPVLDLGPGPRAETAIQLQDLKVVPVPSQRNAPPLFGVSLIDRIPDRVLLDIAAEQAKAADAKGHTSDKVGLPISGRVSRLKDGRIGRFGWKNQVATLREFTLQACASELGLEVPGFHRAPLPWKKDYRAPGIDMSAEQCDLLIQFVASLPRPVQRVPETPQHAAEITAGQKLFASVGCTGCHLPKLGDVEGIYSDLLLHDMGQSLSDAGFYGTIAPDPIAGKKPGDLPVLGAVVETKTREKAPKVGAGTREWRTPPLWGLRDSAPYLHDGRAETIEDAVVLHHGEGLIAAQAFSQLAPRERMQIELFLQSLTAPPAQQ